MKKNRKWFIAILILISVTILAVGLGLIPYRETLLIGQNLYTGFIILLFISIFVCIYKYNKK